MLTRSIFHELGRRATIQRFVSRRRIHNPPADVEEGSPGMGHFKTEIAHLPSRLSFPAADPREPGWLGRRVFS
jgi:hypothetical protein